MRTPDFPIIPADTLKIMNRAAEQAQRTLKTMAPFMNRQQKIAQAIIDKQRPFIDAATNSLPDLSTFHALVPPVNIEQFDYSEQ